MDSIEKEIENHCRLILHKSSNEQNDIRRNDEFWEQRNKAINVLRNIVTNLGPENISCINANVIKLLKNPLKSLILDQRSLQIRDTCAFLTILAEKSGDNMKGLLREIFPTMLEAMKQPNKVVSGYIDDCITSLIRSVTFKHCISGIGMASDISILIMIFRLKWARMHLIKNEILLLVKIDSF